MGISSRTTLHHHSTNSAYTRADTSVYSLPPAGSTVGCWGVTPHLYQTQCRYIHTRMYTPRSYLVHGWLLRDYPAPVPDPTYSSSLMVARQLRYFMRSPLLTTAVLFSLYALRSDLILLPTCLADGEKRLGILNITRS